MCFSENKGGPYRFALGVGYTSISTTSPSQSDSLFSGLVFGGELEFPVYYSNREGSSGLSMAIGGMIGSISNTASTDAADESLSFKRFYFLPELYLGVLMVGTGAEVFSGETETVVSSQRYLKKYTGVLWLNRAALEFSPKKDIFIRPTFHYRFGTFLAEGEAGRYRISSYDVLLQMGFRF